MKLAIIGSGPLAIFCARHFDQLGAEVVLFQKEALGGNVRFLLSDFPQMEISVEAKTKTLKEFWNEDLVPAISLLESHNITRAGEVLRVHKRFLHPGESIAEKSRLHDLFRVIYSVNPREAILKQLEENPEMFKQLGEQVVNSLHTPVESFEDFDLVIDARGRGLPALPMGPSNAPALNEENIKETAPLFYEKEIFTKLSFEGKNQLILVGDDDSAVLALLKCQDWLYAKPGHSLVWITPTPARNQRHNSWLNKKLIELLDFSKTQFDLDKVEFEKKMYEWRDLEDYIRAKIPQPNEPIAKINIFQGYEVTSVDRLLDREGVFATFESPDFRDYVLTPNDLKTLPADAILVGCGVDKMRAFARGMNDEEPGFYRLDARDINEGVEKIKAIEHQILSFFSRAQ